MFEWLSDPTFYKDITTNVVAGIVLVIIGTILFREKAKIIYDNFSNKIINNLKQEIEEIKIQKQEGDGNKQAGRDYYEVSAPGTDKQVININIANNKINK